MKKIMIILAVLGLVAGGAAFLKTRGAAR